MTEDLLADFNEETEAVAVSSNLKEAQNETSSSTPEFTEEEQSAINRVLSELADTYSMDTKVVETAFFKNFADSSIADFTNLRRIKMARGLTKSELQSRGRLTSYDFIVYGTNIIIAKKTNYVYPRIYGLVKYTDENGDTQSENVVVSGFPKSQTDDFYTGILKAMPFHKYQVQLSRGRNGMFYLTEYSDFSIGDPLKTKNKKGKLKTEAEYFEEQLGLTPFESIEEAGFSETDDKGYALSTSLRAIKVLCQSPIHYESPSGHPNLHAIQINAIDFEGEAVTIYTTNTENNNMIFPENSYENVSGIAIGTLSQGTNNAIMSLYHFIPLKQRNGDE